jgi:hypothetical protein
MPPLFVVFRTVVIWMRRLKLHRLYPKNTALSRSLYSLAFAFDNLSFAELWATFKQALAIRVRLRKLKMANQRQAIEIALQSARMIAQYSRSLQFFLRSISSRSIDALLIPEDIVGNIWPVAIAAAHRRGIPALVLPYTLANREEAVQSLKGEEAFQSRNNELAALLFPRWRFRSGDIDLVRLPSAHIFAHEELNITPPDPWTMNSGFADRILVDSQASLDYFAEAGIPLQQLSVVGSVSQDRMFEIRRDRVARVHNLRSRLSLAGDKKLLLISGCPNQLAASVPFCEFSTMAALAEFVGRSLAPLSQQYHLVVRPHPNYVEFGELLEQYGVRSTTDSTASLVPLADLFVAFASATIRWAIGSGVPAINYDVFHYNYSEFTTAAGVVTVTGSTEFETLIRALTPESGELRRLAGRAAADSARWAVLDGQGITRIEQEIARARQRRARA